MITISDTIGRNDKEVPAGLFLLRNTERNRVGLQFTKKSLFAYLFTNLTKTVDGTRYLVNEGEGADAVMHTGQGAYFNGVDNYIDTGFAPDLSQDFTVLINCEETATGVQVNGLDNNPRMYIGLNAGRIYYGVGSIGSTVDALNSVPCLAITKTTDSTAIYQGEEVVKELSPVWGVNTTNFFIGKSSGGFNYTGDIKDVYFIPKALTAQEIAQHYNNPEKTLYWDNGTLKSDILDQATIDSMQAGNGFWYPLTENVSVGGYYRNHALPMPGNLVTTQQADTVQSSWTDNGDGSYSGNGVSKAGSWDLVWLGNIVGQFPLVVEMDVTGYVSGTVEYWIYGTSVPFATGNGTKRIVLQSSAYETSRLISLLSRNFDGTVSNFKVYPLANSGLTPLTNWTATTSTNAKQLTTGYQCALQELDSFGLPIAKPDGLLHGDGRGYIDLQDQVISGDFELDVYIDAYKQINDDYANFIYIQGSYGANVRIATGGMTSGNLYIRMRDSTSDVPYFSHNFYGNGVVTFKRVGDSFSYILNGVEQSIGNNPDFGTNATLKNIPYNIGTTQNYANYQITKGTRTAKQRYDDINKLSKSYIGEALPALAYYYDGTTEIV